MLTVSPTIQYLVVVVVVVV